MKSHQYYYLNLRGQPVYLQLIIYRKWINAVWYDIVSDKGVADYMKRNYPAMDMPNCMTNYRSQDQKPDDYKKMAHLNIKQSLLLL